MVLGWRIFFESVMQVLRNLKVALKLTGLIWIVSFLLVSTVGYFLTGHFASPMEIFPDVDAEWPPMYFTFLAAAFVINVVAFSYIAVLWHRFVLKGETPTGWIPKFSGLPIAEYIRAGFYVFMVLLVILLLISFILGLVIPPSDSFLVFIAPELLMVFLAIYLGMRFSLGLPAVSVGKELSLPQSLKATKPARFALVITVLLLILTSFLLMTLGASIGPIPFGLVVFMVIGWISTLLAVSLLTTLYDKYGVQLVPVGKPE